MRLYSSASCSKKMFTRQIMRIHSYERTSDMHYESCLKMLILEQPSLHKFSRIKFSKGFVHSYFCIKTHKRKHTHTHTYICDVFPKLLQQIFWNNCQDKSSRFSLRIRWMHVKEKRVFI